MQKFSNLNIVLVEIFFFLVIFKNSATGDYWDKFKHIPLGCVKLDIGSSLRLRYQSQHNFNIKKYGQTCDDFFEERFRLELNFKLGNNKRMFIQLQDAHVENLNFTVEDFYPPYSPYENPFDLRQAFIEYQNIANTPLGIKLGRQTIFYGDNRIFGPGEWGNVGRYFWDAAKIIYDDLNYLKMDMFIAQQVMSKPHESDTKKSDLTVYGLYSTIKIFNPAIDLFYVLKKNDKTKLKCSTLGTRFDGNLSMLFYSGTFAYQFGDKNEDDIDAWGYNAKIGYLIPRLWLSELGVEYSYASGDDDPKDGNYKTFDGVLGAIDMYYGRMAFFSWMNLKDYQINLDTKPTRKLSTTLQYHWFKLAESKDAWYYGNGKPQRQDKTGKAGSFLGKEILLAVKYVFNKHFNIFTGYCYFFPGEFIKNTGGYKGESSLLFFQTEYKF
ncbi:MAG: alginate export family protein [Candidatus Hydrogenedentota bacterium]